MSGCKDIVIALKQLELKVRGLATKPKELARQTAALTVDLYRVNGLMKKEDWPYFNICLALNPVFLKAFHDKRMIQSQEVLDALTAYDTAMEKKLQKVELRSQPGFRIIRLGDPEVRSQKRKPPILRRRHALPKLSVFSEKEEGRVPTLPVEEGSSILMKREDTPVVISVQKNATQMEVDPSSENHKIANKNLINGGIPEGDKNGNTSSQPSLISPPKNEALQQRQHNNNCNEVYEGIHTGIATSCTRIKPKERRPNSRGLPNLSIRKEYPVRHEKYQAFTPGTALPPSEAFGARVDKRKREQCANLYFAQKRVRRSPPTKAHLKSYHDTTFDGGDHCHDSPNSGLLLNEDTTPRRLEQLPQLCIA